MKTLAKDYFSALECGRYTVLVFILVVYTKTILMSPSVLINNHVSYWEQPTLKRISVLAELKTFPANVMMWKDQVWKVC